jgi:hypothetical protein
MTAMILMRVIAFVCFVLPYSMYRVYIINFPIPQTKPMEYAIGRLVQAVFSALVNQNYTVSYDVNKFTYVTYSFVLDEFLCVYDIIITFSSSGKMDFDEEMLATMQILLLLYT